MHVLASCDRDIVSHAIYKLPTTTIGLLFIDPFACFSTLKMYTGTSLKVSSL